MEKRDVQSLYRNIKRNRMKNKRRTKSLFEPKKSQGCSTCGKVTWKPYDKN